MSEASGVVRLVGAVLLQYDCPWAKRLPSCHRLCKVQCIVDALRIRVK